MRPINRRASPQNRDFDDYRDAFPELQSRLGPYCSYCERRVATQLAVEHIQPKGLPQYARLIGKWDNFLLACVNCNGTKSDRNVNLAEIFLPDRDNTGAAFIYTMDGRISPSPRLNAEQRQMAMDTLALTGLDKGPNQALDENGKIVAIDRINQRMEVWLIARESKEDLLASPTAPMRRQILRAAQGHGFFSIWMEVFGDDVAMRRLFIEGFMRNGEFSGFPGTAADCYDANTNPITPRPYNGLADGGKI